MNIIQRIKKGWQIGKRSLGVVKEYPKLVILPIISGIATIIFMAVLLGGLAAGEIFLANGGSVGSAAQSVQNMPDYVMYVVLFFVYLGTTFIATFFNVSLVFCAGQAFEGKDPSITKGFGMAFTRIGQILVWSIVAAIVGVIIRVVQEESDLAGNIAAMLFGAAWSIATYFVVPVIAYENPGAFSMFKESANTFRRRWGSTVGSWAYVGTFAAVFVLVSIIIAVVSGALLMPSLGILGILVAVVIAAVGLIIGTTIKSISKAGLYVYTKSDELPEQFEGLDVDKPGQNKEDEGSGTTS
ncbi:MAG: DUF6159 family protein [Halobacteria archaeon]